MREGRSRAHRSWLAGIGLAAGLLASAPGIRAAQLQVDWVDARPGESVRIGARLTTGPGEALAAVSLEIRFDTVRLGEPICALDPRLGPGTSADKGLEWSLPATGVLRTAVVGLNKNTIPAGPLFACDFPLDPKAPGGDLPLPAAAQAATPTGASAPITAASGGVRVDPDPDADGRLYTASGAPCTGGASGACEDNCPFVPNPAQADADGDGVGDACECGDVDGNGRLTTTDVRLVQRCAVGQITGSVCSGLCDVTGDGRCQTIDARILQRVVVGEIPQDQLVCDAQSFHP